MQLGDNGDVGTGNPFKETEESPRAASMGLDGAGGVQLVTERQMGSDFPS